MIRVLLVDDRPATLAGLRMRLALEPDVQVVGEAGDGCTAVKLAETLVPDVVVMDIAMPCLDGIAATAEVRQRSPESAVVVLSLHDNEAMRIRVRESGAAFVSKHESDGPLLAAIRRAAQNEPSS